MPGGPQHEETTEAKQREQNSKDQTGEIGMNRSGPPRRTVTPRLRGAKAGAPEQAMIGLAHRPGHRASECHASPPPRQTAEPASLDPGIRRSWIGLRSLAKAVAGAHAAIVQEASGWRNPKPTTSGGHNGFRPSLNHGTVHSGDRVLCTNKRRGPAPPFSSVTLVSDFTS
jgi:hypothetical protein